jgi:mercuric ion binding protein
MKSVVFIVSICALMGCSSGPNVTKKEQPVAPEKEIKLNVAANQLLEMEVEGMTCEMGCGGTIRKKLQKTGHVGRVRFDFEEGRKIQTARIFIDTTKISSDDVKTLIESLNKGQFKIRSVKKSLFKRRVLS